MAKLPPMTPEQRARRDAAWEYRQQLRKMGYKPGEADRIALAMFPDVTYDQLNPGHGKKSGLKKIVGGIGDVVKKAAPLAALIPGVGPVAAAAIGAAGGLLGNLNDDDGFRGALGDVLLGGLAGGAGGLALEKVPALLQGAGSLFAGGAGAAADAAGGGINVGNVLSRAGRFLLDNPELILGGVSAIAGARQHGKATEAMQRAIDFAMRDAEERRALRGAALERLMGPGPARRDLSEVFASPNPYARPLTLALPPAGGSASGGGQDIRTAITSALGGGSQQQQATPLMDPEALRRAMRSAARQASALSFAA